MTALFNKAGRNGRAGAWVMAALLMVVAAAGAFAQNGKRKTPGSDICVAKSLADYEDAQYTSIQAAVNAARPGQVIEILDTETYDGQVTIDGRDTSPWSGVTGGKNGITIRYVPVGGAAASWNHPRPTIKYRDIINTHPHDKNEAKSNVEQTGSGNFETNGALRVLRAKGVTIEGIAVDGGGPFGFGYTDVWCDKSGGNCTPLNHGNAAITMAVASQVTVRDCELKNAFFGINVKDRNTGGVFGNPNLADQDSTVPLSGFGQVGGHLFEYNKVNANVIGFFFESAWDLGSSVRYNLIFNNQRSNLADDSWKWVGDAASQHNGGAFMFKDMYLSPLAIYNNTLYNNTGNFIGHWQAGGQHLIFNNIFSKSNPSQNAGNDHMSIDGKFPFRMYHCVFSTDSAYLQLQQQGNYCSNNPLTPGGRFVADLRFQGTGFAKPVRSNERVNTCNSGTTVSGTQEQRMVLPGAKILGLGEQESVTDSFFTDANIRWLQTEGLGGGWSELLPSLFKSLSPTSADFLVPDWEKKAVQDFIKNKGWPAAGIRNNDGQIADLGAIPSTGVRQTTVARIMPTAVVLLSGGGANASANFSLKIDNGTINSPKIKLLRWIAPIPTNTLDNPGTASTTDPTGGNWPNRMRPVARDAVRAITNTSAVNVGNNAMSFTTGKTSVPKYGFFEIIVEGTDANGNAVASDVGFLPYRELQYFLDITVYDGSTAVTTVKAGQSYRINVNTRCGSGITNCPKTLSEIEYRLLSGPTAFIRNATTGDTLSGDQNVTFPSNGKDYNPYFFSIAGPETIFSSGVGTVSGQRVIFMGTNDITVKPGDPAKAVFTDPIPVSQLGTAPAPVINRGVDRPVTVEVQDKYGNAVDQAVQVTIASSDVAIGDVGAPGNINTKTVATTTSGVATFNAVVTNGKTNDNFEMTATIPSVTQTDKDNVGRLRLGRALDRFEIFYSDNGPGKEWQTYYKPEVTIDKNVGEWEQIWVKIVVGDTIRPDNPSAKFALISPSDPNLIFSATEGGASATIFPVTAGVATFWVGTLPGTDRDIVNAGITVLALRTNDPNDLDQSVGSNGREGINFTKQSTSIKYAIVYGDGQGRPDSMIIVFAEGGALLTDAGAMPSGVTLTWGGVELTAGSGVLDPRDGLTLKVNSLTVSGGGAKPTGYTSISGLGRGIVTVLGGSAGPEASESSFDVYDGVGPVLANGASGDGAGAEGPKIYENLDGAVEDRIVVTLSEDIRDVNGRFKTLLYSEGPGEPAEGAAGSTLEVVSVSGAGPTYTLVVKAAGGGPQPEPDGWIRLDPSGTVTDLAGEQSGGVVPDNKPHANNRWVQLKVQEVAPSILSAWYTGNSAVGKPDYAYVVFDKPVNKDAWLDGGTVNFGTAVGVNAGNIDFLSVFGDTLKVDLLVAAPAVASSAAPIRTTGDIQFTIKFKTDKAWPDASGSAKDRAAPVLARPAVLKTGSTDGAGGYNKDTLIVYYSESVPAASAAGVDKMPLTLRSKSDKYTAFQPPLQLLGTVEYDRSSGYYVARYLVVDDIALASYPVTGDSVHIYPLAEVGDAETPPNVIKSPDDKDNKWQPLTVDRSANWKVTVKKNPFVSGSGRDSVVVEFSPTAKGVDTMTVKATIRVFDNVGALVVDTTIDNGNGASGDKMVSWTWYGKNKKGRLVGTGTYLFRATCESKASGDKKADVYKTQKMLGVVRGRS